MQPSSAAEIAFAYLRDAQFVSVATFRRDGTPVPTPLWIAGDSGLLVCWTPAGSGKVKRLRRDPRVTLQVCSRRGKVAADAPLLTGTATVEPARADSAYEALRRKYGRQVDVITLVEKAWARGKARDRVAVTIRLDEPGPSAG